MFLLLTVVSLVSLIAVVIAGYYVLAATASPYPNDWMGQMMGGGGMMGGNNGTQVQVQNNAVPYFGLAFVVLVAVAVVGIGGLVYFVVFPEIRITHSLTQPVFNVDSAGTVEVPAVVTTPYGSVLKTLNEDERKVVE
ncbi:MAG TPA: hypothetical protein VJ066_01665, partial [Candidatus Bathyarchaeia archaeon]|nr:hypothetical protein [Candidatus Bathyarchaeia archaeon]